MKQYTWIILEKKFIFLFSVSLSTFCTPILILVKIFITIKLNQSICKTFRNRFSVPNNINKHINTINTNMPKQINKTYFIQSACQIDPKAEIAVPSTFFLHFLQAPPAAPVNIVLIKWNGLIKIERCEIDQINI